MIQNIKVDVIYYMSPSDFEMEFNLCGCCKMRLLADKAADRKALISYMSRAISRSRITIVCGPLFDKMGLIYTTAKAVGRGLVAVNKEEYFINSDEEIKIIEGSVPLVTRDGIFGGLIMESGSQAIILLTDSRSVRKTIMQTLIHPYIEETSLTPEEDKRKQEPAAQPSYDYSAAKPEAEEIREEITEETAQEAKEEAKEEKSPAHSLDDYILNIKREPKEPETEKDYDLDRYESMYVLKTEEEPLREDGNIEDANGFVIEAGHTKRKKTEDYARNYVSSVEDEMFITDNKYAYDDIERRKKMRRWLIALFVLLGTVVFVAVYYLLIIPIHYNIPYSEYFKILFG